MICKNGRKLFHFLFLLAIAAPVYAQTAERYRFTNPKDVTCQGDAGSLLCAVPVTDAKGTSATITLTFFAPAGKPPSGSAVVDTAIKGKTVQWSNPLIAPLLQLNGDSSLATAHILGVDHEGKDFVVMITLQIGKRANGWLLPAGKALIVVGDR